jgi:general stress protein 26
MSEINYTKDKNGLQKMRSLLDMSKIVMMATNLQKTPFSICPMTLQEMDEQGDLWFFSNKESSHFKDITRDNKVQLIYMDEDTNTYISIFGNATHIEDLKKVDELWNPKLKKWFDGKNDPNLALLNMNMENAYYWESASNSLISFFNQAKSVMTEKQSKDGNQGHINLQNH